MDELERGLAAAIAAVCNEPTATLAGSWDPDTVWGGYGGRVYTTAMAALCLEVYYRYLPLTAPFVATPRTAVDPRVA